MYSYHYVSEPQSYSDGGGQTGYDIVVGALPMDFHDEQEVDFTYPVIQSGMVLLTYKTIFSKGYFDSFHHLMNVFTSSENLKVIVVLIGCLFLAANVIWVSERKTNRRMFPRSYVAGIFEALWWASVTLTTVGYGDKVPKSHLGRFCSFLWMFSGIFIIAYFTATISSFHTVERLGSHYEDLESLRGMQVGMVDQKHNVDYFSLRGLAIIPYRTEQELFDAFESGQVKHILFDMHALSYYLNVDKEKLYHVSSEVVLNVPYSFVLPEDSVYQEEINRALLYLLESGQYELIYRRWFEG